MSKKVLRSPLKLLAATSVAIFSLLAVFTSTAAWFDSSKSLGNNAGQMEVNVAGPLERIDVYRAETANVDRYVFSSTPIQQIKVSDWTGGDAEFEYKNSGDSAYHSYDDSKDAVTMNPSVLVDGEWFEDPFSPLSPYHPLMMVFTYREEINASEERVKIFAETDHSFIEDAVAPAPSGEALTGEGIKSSGNPLSSFIRTYSKGYAAVTNIPFTYTAQALKDNSMQKSSFVTIQEEQTPVFDNEPTIFSTQTGNVKKVAVIFEYYIDAVEYVYSNNIGNPIIDNVIYATCDWRLYV